MNLFQYNMIINDFLLLDDGYIYVVFQYYFNYLNMQLLWKIDCEMGEIVWIYFVSFGFLEYFYSLF